MSSSTIASATASAASASASSSLSSSNPAFKVVGICLAIGSGFFIGSSFVIKKKGLLSASKKHGNAAGEGHGYLKSPLWWIGMITMIVGEICNFVAYAFTEAILVTPMGAMSVVVAAILSHFILQEKLNLFGWVGCTLCIIGSVILALNAPEEQSVTTIAGFKALFLSVGFLVWAGICIAAALVVIFYVAPRWGKTNMMPYISVCSIIGGISVSCTQGLGASIITSVQGDNQVKNWFFWFLFVFVVITLLTEINYLNKALELFNTSMVVPVYFCFFTSATMVTSFILYQGLKASAVTLITMVLGFLVTCLGITLLQLSKVDPVKLDGLGRKSTLLLEAAHHATEAEEKGEVTALEDPGMDALRGGFGAVGSIIRARSISRRMSNASTATGRRSVPGLSTHGLDHLQRYHLSDVPMPEDAMDQISLHSKSPVGQHSFQSFQHPPPKRSKSHLKFEDADVVHQYGYKQHDGHTDALHSVRQHPAPAGSVPFPGTSRAGSVPPPVLRGYSSASSMGADGHVLYPPVREEDEDQEVEYTAEPGSVSPTSRHPATLSDEGGISPHDVTVRAEVRPTPIYTEKQVFRYNDPYHPTQVRALPAVPGRQPPVNPRQAAVSPTASPKTLDVPHPNQPTSRTGLSSIFHFDSGPDLALSLRRGSADAHGAEASRSRERSTERGERGAERERSKERERASSQVRGGPHRGTKDYPHLGKSRQDRAAEHDERRALVRSDSDDEADLGAWVQTGNDGVAASAGERLRAWQAGK
ncbi:hypothetical protein Q5752_000203 [Cryptotrichosporon argae]